MRQTGKRLYRFFEQIQAEFRSRWNDPERGGSFRRLVVSVVVTLLLLPKWLPWILSSPLFTPEPSPPVVDSHMVTLETERFEQQLQSSGTLRANRQVDLRSEVSGRVTNIAFEEGEEVKEGDLLVKVNDNDLQAEKRRLESNIELLEQTVSRQQQLFERGGQRRKTTI